MSLCITNRIRTKENALLVSFYSLNKDQTCLAQEILSTLPCPFPHFLHTRILGEEAPTSPETHQVLPHLYPKLLIFSQKNLFLCLFFKTLLRYSFIQDVVFSLLLLLYYCFGPVYLRVVLAPYELCENRNSVILIPGSPAGKGQATV